MTIDTTKEAVEAYSTQLDEGWASSELYNIALALLAERDAAMDHNRKLLALVSSLEANQARHEAEVQTAMAGAVRVKPLAWISEGDYLIAKGADATRMIWETSEGGYALNRPASVHDTLALAQACGDAHHASVIRAKIIPDPERLAKVRVRHVKRGSIYRVIGAAKIQTDRPLVDYAEVTVYQGETDGMIWVRPIDEFEDGRFEAMEDGAT